MDIFTYFKDKLQTRNNIEEKKELLFDIAHYNPEKHPEWQETIEQIESKSMLIQELLSDYESPLREYLHGSCYIVSNGYVSSIRSLEDNKIYDELVDCEDICEKDKLLFKTSKMELCFSNCQYYDAEDIALELKEENNLPLESVNSLMRYFTYTRRYDETLFLYSVYGQNELLKYQYDDCVLRKTGEKKEYKPARKEKIEEFSKFMQDCFDIEVAVGKNSGSRLKDDQYPQFEYITEMDFDSFVAYDVETSGRNRSFDYITEIGAIKVVNGKVVDSEEFKFQELVHPYGKPRKITDDAIKLTGITNEMVESAKTVDEVFNKFADFIGDNILVGYNNKVFDGAFLRRAGRYAKRIITNKQFDLLPVARKYSDCCNNELGTVAKSFGIVNPQAHRAYADAITTARLYFELKKKINN